jgi:hypothetical protein
VRVYGLGDAGQLERSLAIPAGDPGRSSYLGIRGADKADGTAEREAQVVYTRFDIHRSGPSVPYLRCLLTRQPSLPHGAYVARYTVEFSS